MNYHDNLFDKKFLDELSYKLINSAWYANNAANRKSFPKGEYGSHLLLGQLIFKRFAVSLASFKLSCPVKLLGSIID